MLRMKGWACVVSRGVWRWILRGWMEERWWEKLRVLHANLFPSFFTAERAARKTWTTAWSNCNRVIIESGWKIHELPSYDFIRLMLHLYIFMFYALTQANVISWKYFLKLFILVLFFNSNIISLMPYSFRSKHSVVKMQINIQILWQHLHGRIPRSSRMHNTKPQCIYFWREMTFGDINFIRYENSIHRTTSSARRCMAVLKRNAVRKEFVISHANLRRRKRDHLFPSRSPVISARFVSSA